MIVDIVHLARIKRKTADKDDIRAEKLYDKRDDLLEELSSYLTGFGMETEDDPLRQMTEFQMKYDEYIEICDRLRKAEYELQRESEKNMSQIASGKYMPTRENGAYISRSTGGGRTCGYIDIDAQEVITQYDIMLSDLRTELHDIDEAAQDMDARKDELADRFHRYDLVVKTGKLLMEARNKFNSRYTQPVAKEFERYCEMVSEDLPQDMRIDPDMGILYRSDGLYRNSETLSSGLSDIVSVCLRAALADVMYPGEKPVLIFDDPFVNLDDDNRDGAMILMSVISKKYQVIYFTCCENRVL